MSLRESIRKILRETLESEWNEGNYNYQHGFCHYFAYNIIGKIKERFPKKKVNYYLLLASEVDKEDGTIVQEYLIHVYIQIGDKLLDSNGITTKEEAWERAQEWEQRQAHLVPENYRTEMWDEESNEIPEYFFNNLFCNTKRVKEDMNKFLSHPTIEKLLKDSITESILEESKPNPYIIAIRRRLPFISKTRREFIGSVKPCDMTFDDFYEAFEIDVLETSRFEFCDNISNCSNREWENAMDFMIDYLKENHYEWMKEYYDSACS